LYSAEPGGRLPDAATGTATRRFTRLRFLHKRLNFQKIVRLSLPPLKPQVYFDLRFHSDL
jgi:hypothetical protein